MNNVEKRTVSTEIPVNDIQRNVAKMAEKDAELVAVAAIAFVNGLQIGHARANADTQ